MNTVGGKIRATLGWAVLCLVLGLGLSACQKKCQPPVTQKFQTLAESQWRLVETNDASVKGLDRFNFLIYNFARNFSGNIQQVRFNDLFETPFKTFNWNINPDSQQLVIRYQDIAPPTDAPADGATGSTTIARQGPTDSFYSYDLGRELELYDQRGNYYRFVPFTGVVDPDSTCIF
jgi:hypothetical protein